MKKLFDQASEAVKGRTQWEQRQRVYYQMRHEGLRRRNKPWPGAADLHFPLIDMTLRKDKPFWEGQAIASDRLASFVSLKQQQKATTAAAAEFFDFELRQNSNLLSELLRAIDFTRFRGRGVLKATTDPYDEHRLVFEALDPIFIIMDPNADDFGDADWWVHVRHLSLAQYQRDRRYTQTADVLARIKGSKDLDVSTEYWQDKEAREGIQYSRDPEQVILWEHWVKTMGGYTVHTYAPQAADAEVRKPFSCAYKGRGGKKSQPFFSFKTEIKDKGWYAPRGLAELLAPFEQYACKLWNEKTDAMTFANRPVFTSEQAINNTANIRWNPGEFIPGNVRQVATAPPAISFDQEMAFTRGTAEQLAMLPDFGIAQPGMDQGGGGKPRTATENQRIAQLQSVGTESNGRLFRLDLAKVYRHCWALMLQFRRKELLYYVAGELKTLPAEALHDAYLIEPDGSPDQWNKQLRLQNSMRRLQTFAGSPNVDQDVLVRDALAADDPLLAVQAFIPTALKAANEAEDEAQEIGILRDGFPAAVRPDEDHATRIHVLLAWMQKQTAVGAPLDPLARQRVQEHLALHFQFLGKLNPQAARQLLAQLRGQQAPPAAPGAAPPMPGTNVPQPPNPS